MSKSPANSVIRLRGVRHNNLKNFDLDLPLKKLIVITGLSGSVIVIEHKPDLTGEADWIIDLGPEGGDGGGRIVAQGTPEQIARNKRSHTGYFLRSVLAR